METDKIKINSTVTVDGKRVISQSYFDVYDSLTCHHQPKVVDEKVEVEGKSSFRFDLCQSCLDSIIAWVNTFDKA